MRLDLARPRLVTSASSFGRPVTDVHLLLKSTSGEVVRRAAYAQNKIVTRADLVPEADGDVTYGAAFTVQRSTTTSTPWT